MLSLPLSSQWLLPPGIRLGRDGSQGPLPRPRYSELGPRPPRKLPRDTEAGEDTGLGQGRRLRGITLPSSPQTRGKHRPHPKGAVISS